eukprot:7674261-Prorocentrum_lima.AAC.1
MSRGLPGRGRQESRGDVSTSCEQATKTLRLEIRGSGDVSSSLCWPQGSAIWRQRRGTSHLAGGALR